MRSPSLAHETLAHFQRDREVSAKGLDRDAAVKALVTERDTAVPVLVVRRNRTCEKIVAAMASPLPFPPCCTRHFRRIGVSSGTKQKLKGADHDHIRRPK
jgi:hypothetical protein